MREDQYTRLLDLEEKLTEQFLAEADPVNWSADGLTPKDMSKDQRGDRYWCKKNAVATIALTIRIGSLVGAIQRRGEVSPPVGEGEGAEDTSAGLLDAEVSAAEKEARALMARFEKRAKAAG